MQKEIYRAISNYLHYICIFYTTEIVSYKAVSWEYYAYT